jgi:thiamine pyrophosphate-dependent acetolactate synthase large subunit-like protein
VLLVLNNGGFAAEAQQLRLERLPQALSLYANPSFADVARSLGADGVTVSTVDDLKGLDRRISGLRGPLVVDCRVPIDAASEWAGVARRMHTTTSREPAVRR